MVVKLLWLNGQVRRLDFFLLEMFSGKEKLRDVNKVY